MEYLFSLSPLIILFLIISFIINSRKILKTNAILAKRRYEGFKLLVEMADSKLPIGRELYVFAPENSRGRPMAAQIMLGVAEEQSGTLVKISLLGRFQRADDNTIWEVIKDGFPQRVYKVGQDLPIALDRNVPMRQSTVHMAKIVQLQQP